MAILFGCGRGGKVISFNKLNNIEYIREKQAALITARRTAPESQQRAINIELNLIYEAKYKLLKREF